ncbi:MAG: helix-turn-helix domain-containing protein [Eubacterium sp.]|nr:helix-turn-helix domain-containing protein [Eubacterium sp.]
MCYSVNNQTVIGCEILAYYKRIKDLREDHDKTQKEIADYLDMKQPQYSRYENGLRDIPSDILIKLADYYNVSTDYIFGRTNNPKISK